MTLRIEPLTKDSRHLSRAKRLMINAFPVEERVPVTYLLQHKSKELDLWAFCDENLFCGFACIFSWRDISFICWLAVEEKLRNKGYGGQMLEAIKAEKAGRRIVLDIERLDIPAANHEERERRKAFYLRHGFLETGVFNEIYGVKYELLLIGDTISSDDVKDIFCQIRKRWS